MSSSAITDNNTRTTSTHSEQESEQVPDDPMDLDEESPTPVIPEYALRRRGAMSIVDGSLQTFLATRVSSEK
ncbi:hypothetical protein K7432_011966 [Basidiobolus ranarum]|uniref:Uncharacterized protein n=1 Tax=Basidiobolus ranarum TaxID=34480 RepID=A0ABR2VT13_9FUNG